MVVLLNKSGNHSNRLFQTIHLEAFCLHNDIVFINCSFADMERYYHLKKTYALAGLLLKVSERLGLIHCINLDDVSQQVMYENMLLHSKVCFVGGWSFRKHELTKAYRSYFAEKYTPKNKYTHNSTLLQHVTAMKNNGVIVVGVHIRRCDYSVWEEGKYYYDDGFYKYVIDVMNSQIVAEFGKKPHFILFSDETIGIKESETATVSRNEWFVDHLIMSMCDYLVGPPSTFTMWASYIGATKYFHLTDVNVEITLDKFVICDG